MMDAVEFLKEKDRMCRAICIVGGFVGRGDKCEIERQRQRECGQTCNGYIVNHPEEAVEIVERWAKEHPRKTRQSEFLKMFPRVDMTADGVIAFCPENMDSTFVCPIKERDHYDPECGDCRKKYWLEEVEDDD